jgi:2-polyprenyl-3-methyl-5-hydroxy-6-metoxy-1,4-benzoquinol methylase
MRNEIEETSMVASNWRPDVQARTHDELFQFGGTLKQVQREHARLMPFFKGARTVLDVGCGRGVFLQMLRDVGISPVGVDIFSEAVQQCKELGFDQIFCSDALKFLRQHYVSFDGILCSHIIEHMPYDDAIELVRSAFDALTPGGRLVVVTPNPRDVGVIGELFWLDPTHVRPYPMPLLDAMFQSVGFSVVHKANPVVWPNKRAIPRWAVLRAMLGSRFGRPNTIIVGQKPAA